MTTEKTQRLLAICSEVAKDVENDANNFEGQPFTGKTMASYMGYHGAAICALANILKEIIIELKQTINA